MGQLFLQPSASQPSWQQQQWLGYPDGSEILYARKNFNLVVKPEWAFVTVSAIDEFSIYLNGQLIGEKKLPGGTPAEAYDVTPVLQLGKNTLAIRSESQQRHRNAQTIARLNWRVLGNDTFLSSYGSWRVDNKESFQRQGQVAWFQNEYEDSGWTNAIPATNTFDKQAILLSISSDELQKLRPINWIWINHLGLRHMSISRNFTLNTEKIGNAWLAINIDGSYQLTINGLAFPTRSARQDAMEYFAIAPYLQKGKNSITLQVQSAENRLDKIAITGLVTTNSSQKSFRVDSEWHCGKALCRFSSIAPGQYPPILKAIVLTDPLKYTLLQWYKQFKWFFLVFFTSLIPAIWLIPLLTAHNRFSFPQACLIYSQPFGFVALLLATILISNADPRCDLAPYYPAIVPLLVVMVVVLLLFRLGTEYKHTNNIIMEKD
ncbi:MAG: hypothetical protein DRR42_03725 [Gammaproteobacteria bacterium]|nr:MAG: hypothetical protein DRR42_03725 [Gammaproteobacteria bacterium]